MIRPIWYLSPDETGGAGTAEAGSDTAQNQATTNDATDDTGTDTGVGSSAETEKTESTQSGAGTVAGRGSNYVPYDRFHEVNTKYREESAQRARLETELSFIKEQIAASKQKPQEQIDPETQRAVDYYTDKMVNPAVKPLTQRLEKLEEELKARDESQKLEKAIGEMEAKYPAIKDAPYAKNMLINEYILNPKSNLGEMAKSINDFLISRDKATIAEYVKGKQAAGQHKGATVPGSGPANKPASLPKNASLNDIFKRAETGAVAFLQNAKK